MPFVRNFIESEIFMDPSSAKPGLPEGEPAKRPIPEIPNPIKPIIPIEPAIPAKIPKLPQKTPAGAPEILIPA